MIAGIQSDSPPQGSGLGYNLSRHVLEAQSSPAILIASFCARRGLPAGSWNNGTSVVIAETFNRRIDERTSPRVDMNVPVPLITS